MFFVPVLDFIGEKDAKYVESTFRWAKEYETLKKKHNVTKQDLSDMIYYRQKTGNPNIKGDTFDSLSKRLGDPSKEFVDNTVDKHFKESIKEWNDNPITRNITPREGMEDLYLPGLYEYDPKKFKDNLKRRMVNEG